MEGIVSYQTSHVEILTMSTRFEVSRTCADIFNVISVGLYHGYSKFDYDDI